MDQNANPRVLKPSQMGTKIDTRRAVATDAEGGELRPGDLVKEMQRGAMSSAQEPRQGRVLHVFRNAVAFLHNRDIAENGGVFVARPKQLGSVAPKTGMGMDTTRMNPERSAGLGAFSPAGQSGLLGAMGQQQAPMARVREVAVGAHVTIVKGPHKGLKGICKDMNGPLARIELHTRNRTITIERTKLGVEWDGNLISLEEWEREKQRFRGGAGQQPSGFRPQTSSYGGSSGYTPHSMPHTPSMYTQSPSSAIGGRTPMYASGKTPLYQGGKTPMYGAGGRTPYGGATPFGGGATPFGAGNATPYAAGRTYGSGDAFAVSCAWSVHARDGFSYPELSSHPSHLLQAGSRTPYQSSSRTPYGGAAGASNAAWGSTSPAYNATTASGSGGAAAAWGSASPAYTSGAPASNGGAAWGSQSPAYNGSASANKYSGGSSVAAANTAWGSTSPAYQQNASSAAGGSAWDSEQPVNTPYASAPTPAAQTPYPSAPTPAAVGNAWDSYDSAPTPAAAPTPYAAAATPAAGDDSWD